MNQVIYEALLDTVDTPIVFVDSNHVIRHLNKPAKIRYYEKRGYSDLVGASLFECHNAASEKQVKQIHGKLAAGKNEVFLKVNDDNEKITVVAVRDTAGKLLGYYERIEKIAEPE